jgi:hypothetical protein
LHEFHELKAAGEYDVDNRITIPAEKVAAQLRV